MTNKWTLKLIELGKKKFVCPTDSCTAQEEEERLLFPGKASASKKQGLLSLFTIILSTFFSAL